MKRTFKAWLYTDNRRPLKGDDHDKHRLYVYQHRKGLKGYGLFEIAPCTITYDDGRPAPRKRKGGGK